MQLKNIVIAAGFAFAAVSCNQVDFKKTKTGLPYKHFESKSGKKVEGGKFVKMHVEQKIKDSVIFSTYKALPVYFQVPPTGQPYDVSELFTLMKEGDSVYAVQAMDTFIKKNPMIVQQTPYRNGDKIVTTVRILKVFETADQSRQDEEKERLAIVSKEETAVKQYLSKNNINAQRTPSGAYVQVVSEGAGAPVEAGKSVSVMYKGQTFGGTVFDSNMDSTFGHTDPMSFTVGVGQMIKGFDEGVVGLKEGTKCKIFIPSMLAYGAQPPSPQIKPFEHLIFDVEVLKVTAAPSQPQIVPQPSAPAPDNH
jgi:FKBP-type peptidyl-prolyl cis-trans isomerase FkpA